MQKTVRRHKWPTGDQFYILHYTFSYIMHWTVPYQVLSSKTRHIIIPFLIQVYRAVYLSAAFSEVLNQQVIYFQALNTWHCMHTSLGCYFDTASLQENKEIMYYIKFLFLRNVAHLRYRKSWVCFLATL